MRIWRWYRIVAWRSPLILIIWSYWHYSFYYCPFPSPVSTAAPIFNTRGYVESEWYGCDTHEDGRCSVLNWQIIRWWYLEVGHCRRYQGYDCCPKWNETWHGLYKLFPELNRLLDHDLDPAVFEYIICWLYIFKF